MRLDSGDDGASPCLAEARVPFVGVAPAHIQELLDIEDQVAMSNKMAIMNVRYE